MVKFQYKHNLDSQYVGFRVFWNLKKKEFKNFIRHINIQPLKKNMPTVAIIGCGHSGTSLTAGKLSRHPNIAVIGYETGWFFPTYDCAKAKENFLSEMNKAASLGKDLIIEKTPKHLHSYKRIKKIVPNNQFICIVRNPLDTIASLYRRFGSIENAIDRWVVDNTEILNYQNRENSIIINYESLTQQPREVFITICEFIKVDFSEIILESGATSYDKNEDMLPENMKLRKQQVSQPIKPRINAWKDVFDKAEAIKIINKTEAIATKLGYSYTKNLDLIL